MNCFNHPDKNAVGLCKSCSKGLCLDCATDLGHGIACKNNHESNVEDLNMIIKKSTKIYSSAQKNTLLIPTFLLFMGSVFISFGYFSKSGVTSLPFIMGIGFVVYSVLIFIRNKSIFGKNV